MTTTALVTGASSGIGYHSALRLHERGFKVYAAARRPMSDLEQRGISTVRLDVTVEDSMRQAIDTVMAQESKIDILVNNAGYGSYGAIEEVPLSEARRQFDVNVFGAMRLIQLVLPHMMTQDRGRIINVSSIGSGFSMALGGWYHATKYAIEALSDALRQEVRPFGIDVILVQPGLIHTNWESIAAQNLRSVSGLGKYSLIAKNFATALDAAGGGLASQPEVIADVIAHACTTAHPKTRYRKGMGAFLTRGLPLLPDRLVDTATMYLLNNMETIISRLTKR
ncbi:MAG: oxidoreductase [Propionibacteriaceae bacterium]|nr:oxidoreductase [Propionibacteriaceae bacterium]